MDKHATFMALALKHAHKGRGFVSPNPMVGCVIVKDGKVIASAHHAEYGGPHAEALALDIAGDQAMGATMYVTLEPCCHTGSGKKTPPCAPRVAKAALARVVVAMRDPNPRVSGAGIKLIGDAGIEVEVGILGDEARHLNRTFVSLMKRSRPWVLAKWAMTYDGRLIAPAGESPWISSKKSRKRVHIERRAYDAIVVGIGTALTDNPMLNNRSGIGKQPLRIVVDPRLELPLDSKLADTAKEYPLLVMTTSSDQTKREALESKGAEIATLVSDANDHLSWPEMLDVLGARDCSSVMIEGGPSLLKSAFEAKIVDEVMVFVAPKRPQNQPVEPASQAITLPYVGEASTLQHLTSERYGDDLMISGLIAESPFSRSDTSLHPS